MITRPIAVVHLAFFLIGQGFNAKGMTKREVYRHIMETNGRPNETHGSQHGNVSSMVTYGKGNGTYSRSQKEMLKF